MLTERTLSYYSDRGGKKKGEILMPAVVFIDEVRLSRRCVLEGVPGKRRKWKGMHRERERERESERERLRRRETSPSV